MATSVARTLAMPYGGTAQYVTLNSNVRADYSIIGIEANLILYNRGTTGYCTLNSDAMNVLYPTATAHPYRLDHYMKGGSVPQNNTNCYIHLLFDGTAVQLETNWTDDRNVERNMLNCTVSAVTNSTRSSTIRYVLGVNRKSIAQATGTNDISIILYFWQYSCVANTAGNGVTSASVSNDTPWDGDSVTFSATLKSGATWHGWYSDAACTQLVSTAQTYTTTAADLSLYAYATKDTTATGIYLKQNGAYTQAQAAYKKVNGVWVQQADIATLKTEIQSGKYKLAT